MSILTQRGEVKIQKRTSPRDTRNSPKAGKDVNATGTYRSPSPFQIHPKGTERIRSGDYATLFYFCGEAYSSDEPRSLLANKAIDQANEFLSELFSLAEQDTVDGKAARYILRDSLRWNVEWMNYKARRNPS